MKVMDGWLVCRRIMPLAERLSSEFHSFPPSLASRPAVHFSDNLSALGIILHYYTTQAVRRPITKINQSKCSITGPIFSKYWTGHCPE